MESQGTQVNTCTTSEVLSKEESFLDEWADSIQIDNVMVDEFFEACTSPVNKIILEKLGEVSGKRLLELGCGAGEASVYFAKKGAIVTATDISQGMLQVVEKVADKHNVRVTTNRPIPTQSSLPMSHLISSMQPIYSTMWILNKRSLKCTGC